MTPISLLVANMAAKPISSMYLQAGINEAGNQDLFIANEHSTDRTMLAQH